MALGCSASWSPRRPTRSRAPCPRHGLPIEKLENSSAPFERHVQLHDLPRETHGEELLGAKTRGRTVGDRLQPICGSGPELCDKRLTPVDCAPPVESHREDETSSCSLPTAFRQAGLRLALEAAALSSAQAEAPMDCDSLEDAPRTPPHAASFPPSLLISMLEDAVGGGTPSFELDGNDTPPCMEVLPSPASSIDLRFEALDIFGRTSRLVRPAGASRATLAVPPLLAPLPQIPASPIESLGRPTSEGGNDAPRAVAVAKHIAGAADACAQLIELLQKSANSCKNKAADAPPTLSASPCSPWAWPVEGTKAGSTSMAERPGRATDVASGDLQAQLIEKDARLEAALNSKFQLEAAWAERSRQWEDERAELHRSWREEADGLRAALSKSLASSHVSRQRSSAATQTEVPTVVPRYVQTDGLWGDASEGRLCSRPLLRRGIVVPPIRTEFFELSELSEVEPRSAVRPHTTASVMTSCGSHTADALPCNPGEKANPRSATSYSMPASGRPHDGGLSSSVCVPDVCDDDIDADNDVATSEFADTFSSTSPFGHTEPSSQSNNSCEAKMPPDRQHSAFKRGSTASVGGQSSPEWAKTDFRPTKSQSSATSEHARASGSDRTGASPMVANNIGANARVSPASASALPGVSKVASQALQRVLQRTAGHADQSPHHNAVCQVGSPPGDAEFFSPGPPVAQELLQRVHDESERSWSDLGPQVSFGVQELFTRCRNDGSDRSTAVSSAGRVRTPQHDLDEGRGRVVSFGDGDSVSPKGKPRLRESSAQTTSPPRSGQVAGNFTMSDLVVSASPQSPRKRSRDVSAGTSPPRQHGLVSTGTLTQQQRRGATESSPRVELDASMCDSSAWATPEDVPDVRLAGVSTATSPLREETLDSCTIQLDNSALLESETRSRQSRTFSAGSQTELDAGDMDVFSRQVSAASDCSDGFPESWQGSGAASAGAPSPVAGPTGLSAFLPQKTPSGTSPATPPANRRLQLAFNAPPSASASPSPARTPIRTRQAMHAFDGKAGELTEVQEQLALLLCESWGSPHLALERLCAAQDSQGGLSAALFRELAMAERSSAEGEADREVYSNERSPGVSQGTAYQLWQAIAGPGSTWISVDDLYTLLVPLTCVDSARTPESAEVIEARRKARENEKFLARGTVSQKALQFEKKAREAATTPKATTPEAKAKGSPLAPHGPDRQKHSPSFRR